MEEWKPVVGWESRYEVSNLGNVRSLDNYRKNNLTGGVSLYRGKTLKPCDSGNGYLRVYIGGKRVFVHRLVCTAFHGPQPENADVVRHLDGNPSNNQEANLRWGTFSENEADKLSHGRNPFANKTHCPQGHPYDESNTYRDPKGTRRCRECARQENRDKRNTPLPNYSEHHGTAYGYLGRGCRCERCKLAGSEYTSRKARRDRAEKRLAIRKSTRKVVTK